MNVSLFYAPSSILMSRSVMFLKVYSCQ